MPHGEAHRDGKDVLGHESSADPQQRRQSDTMTQEGGGLGTGTGKAKGNGAASTTTERTTSSSTQYGPSTTKDPVLGMRRRSSIVTDVNSENPLFSVPASRQKTPHLVPTSTASGTSLHAQVPLLHDPRSPVPRHLRPVPSGPLPIPFQSTFLSTFDELETPTASPSGSETASISNSPTIMDKDGLMSMSAQDLRRPSFLDTVAATSLKPDRSKRRSSSFVSSILSWRLSRRMIRILRLWIFAIVALFLATKALDYILPRLRNSPQVREFFDQDPSLPPIEDALKEQMRQVAESIPRPSPRVEKASSQISTGQQVAFELQREKEPSVNLDQVEQFRKRYLWRAPDEDALVHFANPTKGHAHESTVIFLHGMRQKAGEAFLPVNMHSDFASTRWVLPQANNRTISVSPTATEVWPSWFDLSLPYDPASANGRLPHLFASVRILNQVIRAERALLILRRREALAGHSPGWVSDGPRPGLVYTASHGPDSEGRGAGPVPVEPGFLESFGTEEERRWASKRIILAGFSQGSVVSLMTGLSGQYPLGGIAVFSGFLPMRWELPKLISDLETRDIPVFWGHGSDDKILTLDDAIASVNLMRHDSLVEFFAPLKNLPANFTLPSPPAEVSRVGMTDVTFRVYPSLGHSWCHDEVRELKRWANKIVPTGSEVVKQWS